MVSHSHGFYQKPSLKPTITAHLAQTMALLSLNNLELAERITGEIAKNPALELLEERRCPTCGKRLSSSGQCAKCTFTRSTDPNEPVVFVSPPNDVRQGTILTLSDNETSFEELSAESEDLPTYVGQQVASELEPAERLLAAHILTCLDEDGFLGVPVMDIARYNHCLPSDVEAVLEKIQRCEPIGVGARSSQEALQVQLEMLAESHPVSPLAFMAVQEGYDALVKTQFRELGKILGVSVSKAEQIAEFISENLNPFPARAHWGNHRHRSEHAPQAFHKPDVIINTLGTNGDTRLMVEIMYPLGGTLRVNPEFTYAIKDAPENKSEQWQEDLEKANLLVKCLSQRNHTLVRLMDLLARKQRDFILRGETEMKPITRAQLADELQVHESTISRAVSGKSVQLPSGQIVPIKRFFDRSLHIRAELKDIIEHEEKPLSDTKIAKMLEKRGHKIARRTVAKYRSMEGILPAHLRN